MTEQVMEEVVVDPKSEPKSEPWRMTKARLTVNEKVYFQPREEKAEMIETAYSTEVESDEQLYIRGPIKMKEGWQPIIDGCWIKPSEMGLIVICNCEGKKPQVIPSKEEIEELNGRVIEVYIRNATELRIADLDPNEFIDDKSTFILIGPKESQKFRVSDARDIFVRPKIAGIKIKLFITPK